MPKKTKKHKIIAEYRRRMRAAASYANEPALARPKHIEKTLEKKKEEEPDKTVKTHINTNQYHYVKRDLRKTLVLSSLTTGDVYEIVDTGVVTACDAVCPATATTSCAAVDTNLAPYLASLPVDPTTPAAGHTSYSVSVNASGIVTVNACGAEGSTISVSR